MQLNFAKLLMRFEINYLIINELKMKMNFFKLDHGFGKSSSKFLSMLRSLKKCLKKVPINGSLGYF
jgi:hypothetical protein